MFSKKHTLILLICVELAYLSFSELISPTLPVVLNTTGNSTMASPKVDLGSAKSGMLNLLFSHLRRYLKTLFRRFKQLEFRLLH